MKKTPLKRHKPFRSTKAPRKGRKPGKATRKALKPANKARRAKLWARCFLSDEFVQFVQDLPCVRCRARPSKPHHEPPRSRGGTWKNVSPVCANCHTLAGDSRHNVGPDTFWTFGVTYEESNRRVHFAWLQLVAETRTTEGGA